MSKPKRPWALTLFAAALILLGAPLLVHGSNEALAGKHAGGSGAITQGIVNIATGILILMHHKFAVFSVGICAVLFTIACIADGLTPLDLLQVVFIWIGFSWYRSWRSKVEPQASVGPTT
jgi:uncharacterized membrane-anchored protein